MNKLILVILIMSGIHAFAGNDGGGGSRIESAFRLTATELIEQISKNKGANTLCVSSIIQGGLNTSKIRVVDTLMDLNTGKAVTDHYDAWTRPGTIQLKRKVWFNYLKGSDRYDSDIYALILHELYRTTKSCDDDTGALSTAVIRLLREPGQNGGTLDSTYLKLFAFKYQATNLKPYYMVTESYWGRMESMRFQILRAVCEHPMDFSMPVAGNRCYAIGKLMYENGGKWAYDPIGYNMIFVTTNDKDQPIYKIAADSTRMTVGVVNMLSFISPQQIFYSSVNLKNGEIKSSYDLTEITGGQ